MKDSMSKKTLTDLLNYLYGTLTPSDMTWVAERLISHAKETEVLEPYTKEELKGMVEDGRRDIAEGRCYTTEEVLEHCEQDDLQYVAEP